MAKLQERGILPSVLAFVVVCCAVGEVSSVMVNPGSMEASHYDENKLTAISVAPLMSKNFLERISEPTIIFLCLKRNFYDINMLANHGAQIVVDMSSTIADISKLCLKCENSKCLSDLLYKNFRVTWDAYDKTCALVSDFKGTLKNIADCIAHGR